MGEIVLQGVRKSFGAVDVLRDIDLTINEGEFVVFVGPSGCGKSTLLRTISGLEEVTAGNICINGRDVTHDKPSERNLAMVFQSYALFPHLTVRENIGFGLKIAGKPRAEIESRVAEASGILGLDELLERKPRELSGGQQQRVAIGRAIVREPAVFLFDEPLSNLDAALRVQMRVELIRLHDKLKTTMVYVTHDQAEAMTMANRIVVLRGGVVEQFASPIELYDRPANKFVASFLGSPTMNFFEAARVADGRVQLVGGPAIALPNLVDEAATAKLTLGIRPEHIEYAGAGGDIKGTVVVEEQMGSDAYLYVEVEGIGMVTVRGVGERNYHHGDTVHLTLPASRCHVFDETERRINRV